MKESGPSTLISNCMYHNMLVGVSFVYFQADLLSFSIKLSEGQRNGQTAKV